MQNFTLAPPSQPSIPAIESSGATWVHVFWTAPLVAHSPISYYEIILARIVVDDISKVISTDTNINTTNFNVTGLFPGMAYELTVVAISEGGNITARSPESDSLLIGVTKPSRFI